LRACPSIVREGASFVGNPLLGKGEAGRRGSWKEDVGKMRGKSREKERDFKWDSRDPSTPLAKRAEIPPLIN
jgi:hypothetical protein